jgi:hypothetical protein
MNTKATRFTTEVRERAVGSCHQLRLRMSESCLNSFGKGTKIKHVQSCESAFAQAELGTRIRLLESIKHMPLAQAGANYRRQLAKPVQADLCATTN